MRVSVVIPVKDDPRVVECVASIRRAQRGQEAQVIVVDNGSGPSFREHLDALRDGGVTVVEAGGTVYAARNAGIDAAGGEVVFFTDADCVVEGDWLEQGVRAALGELHVAQGFAGSVGDGWRDRLIQARYAAQWRHARPLARALCDTRNLAVRREVLEHVRFEERYRRVGDTEFGLRAEVLGFRVGYAPGMRVAHAHDRSLDVFVAKQVCHGWGAQRLMFESPGLPWSGNLRLAARLGPRLRSVPGTASVGRALVSGSVAAGRLLDRAGPRLQFPLGVAALTVLDKSAGLGGHLTFRPGEPEPSPSEVLGRELPRN